jgi:hypothetical protein
LAKRSTSWKRGVNRAPDRRDTVQRACMYSRDVRYSRYVQYSRNVVQHSYVCTNSRNVPHRRYVLYGMCYSSHTVRMYHTEGKCVYSRYVLQQECTEQKVLVCVYTAGMCYSKNVEYSRHVQ